MSGGKQTRMPKQQELLPLLLLLLVTGSCTGQEVVGEVLDLSEPVKLSTATGVLAGEVSSTGAVWLEAAVTEAQLQGGDVLAVLDGEGTVVEEVTAEDLKEGGLPFWVSVIGSVLKVQLRREEGSTHEASATLGMMFPEVDESRKADALSICGANQKKDALCFKWSNPTVFQKSRAVARIVMPCSPGSKKMCTCTAWRVGPKNNTMVTNHHCLRGNKQLGPAKVFFGYQATSCNGGDAWKYVVTVRPQKILITGSGFDYTLFTVWGVDKIKKFGALELDNRDPKNKEWIYIPQHPGGRKKELAVKDDEGECTIRNAWMSNNRIGYRCDTEKGSSGSPVLSRDTHKVVGLHFSGGCNNRAHKAKKLYEKMAGFLYDDNDADTVVDTEGTADSSSNENETSPCPSSHPVHGCGNKCFVTQEEADASCLE